MFLSAKSAFLSLFFSLFTVYSQDINKILTRGKNIPECAVSARLKCKRIFFKLFSNCFLGVGRVFCDCGFFLSKRVIHRLFTGYSQVIHRLFTAPIFHKLLKYKDLRKFSCFSYLLYYYYYY